MQNNKAKKTARKQHLGRTQGQQKKNIKAEKSSQNER